MSAASKCASCRHSLLRAFVTFADLPCRTALKPNRRKLSLNALNPLTSIRPFSFISARRSDNTYQGSNQPANLYDETPQDDEHTALDQGTPEPVSQQPWYLQVETPQREPRSLSERQQLPELPSNPPPLLQPILEHVSIDLGLDDLSLFDLRKLDPPPALGANLLLIVGTARSQKHLHVSADRFCRWLRATHKLTPYADGLMGRGELKLMMKRKARRARILSRVGSSERYNHDDGLTTGWICVDVGRIEDGKGVTEKVLEPEGFVGFGEKVGGAKVVIQMLTEEKRLELDLEELWEKMLKRHERKEARIENSSEAAINDGQSPNDSLRQQNLSSNASSIALSNHRSPSFGNYQQRREFHNNASHLELNHISQKMAEDPSLNSQNRGKTPKPQPLNLQFESIKSERSAGNSGSVEAEKSASDKNLLHLKSILNKLRSRSREHAFKALGTGIKDWSSTSFLASFYKSYPLFPQEDHWECRFAMVCHAIRIGHPGYDKRDLLILVNQMRATIVYVPSSIALNIIDTLLSRDATAARSNKKPGMDYSFGIQDFQDSLTLLDLMELREVDSNLKKVLTTFYGATAYASENKFPLGFRTDVNAHLRLYMDFFDIVVMDTETHSTVLNIFAVKNNWEAFWTHWNGIARRMQPKPAELYALMFHRVAETKHQIQCIAALRNLVPEMKLEKPPVRLEGEVAKAVMECLRVVAPDLESGLSNPGWRSEARWADLWKRCDLSLRHADPLSHNPSALGSEEVGSDQDFAPSY